MTASTRRSRTTLLRRRDGRPHAGLALLAALTLGLAACGDDAADETEDTPEIEEPADDVEAPAEDDTAVEDDETAAPEPEPVPSFTDLEDGEVVPGIRIDAPIDEDAAQGQPTPTGSAFIAALADETGALTVNVEFEGQELDQMLGGIDALVESGQAEVTSGPDEIEVEGADEASRVELAAPSGDATAIGIFATADGNSISLAIEVLQDADIDVEAIIDSIEIDADRLQAEGTLELDEAPGTADGAVDGGLEDDGLEGTDPDAGTDDASVDGDDAATDPDEDA
jgi:hypothetical protein